MQANTNQWYVRWFIWSCRVLDRFNPADYHADMRERRALEEGTNLCTFFRTLLWGLLVSAYNLLAYAALVYAVLILPFQLFNLSAIAAVFMVIFSVVVVATAFTVGISAVPYAAGKIVRHVAKRRQDDGPPGFLKVCWRYLVGIKQRFCPMITFVQENRDA